MMSVIPPSIIIALAAAVMQTSAGDEISDHVHAGSATVNEESCKRVVAGIRSVTDIALLYGCMDFYWHNGHLDDPPGSFNNRLKIGYRIIDLEPEKDWSIYPDMASDLYSKWVIWQTQGAVMPDGENRLCEAIELWRYGQEHHPYDVDYHIQAGSFLFQYYRTARRLDAGVAEECWEESERYMIRARDMLLGEYERLQMAADQGAGRESASAADHLRRSLLTVSMRMGRFYRDTGMKRDAVTAYERALEIEPQNEVAIKEIRRLRAGGDQGE